MSETEAVKDEAHEHIKAHPEKYCRISYGDFELTAPLHHVEMFIKEIRCDNAAKKQTRLKDAVKYIEAKKDNLDKEKDGEVISFCTAIAFWFANEVVEGRLPLMETLH